MQTLASTQNVKTGNISQSPKHTKNENILMQNRDLNNDVAQSPASEARAVENYRQSYITSASMVVQGKARMLAGEEEKQGAIISGAAAKDVFDQETIDLENGTQKDTLPFKKASS